MAFGFSYSDSSEPQKAVDSYNLALPILRRLKDNNRQAAVLGFIGTLYRDLGERQKSLEALNQALSIHRSLNDRAGEAKTLYEIGRHYSGIWERPKALDFYARTLSIWREVGDRASEAATLNAIGRIYDDFGESKKALDFYNQSLALRRADGDRQEEANTLRSIGTLYSTLGEKQKALELLNQVLALQRTVGNRKGEAYALSAIGMVYSDLGDRRKALEFYNQAFSIQRELKDQAGMAVTLASIGLAYFGLGDNQKTLDLYNQALPILRAEGNRVGEAALLNNLGMLYIGLGEGSKSLEFLHQALSMQRTIGDRIGEIKSLNNIAALYDAADEEQKALEFYSEALSVEREIGYRSAEPAILHNLGNVYFALGENQKALNLLKQALPLERDIGDREGEARTLLSLGELYNSLGEKAMALDYYKQSLTIEHAIGDRKGEAVAHFMLGRWWEEQHNRALAIFHGKEAVNILQGLRRDIQRLDKETQKTYLDTVINAYRSLADMLLSEDRLPEAEEVIGMLKEQEFKDFTRGQLASNGSIASLTPEERRAESILSQGLEWRELSQVANRTPQQQERYEQLGKTLTDNNVKTTDFWQALQANMPAMAVHAAKSESAAAQKLLRKLPAGTIVVYTLVLKDKLDLLVIAPQAIVKSTVVVKQADLAAAVEALRSAIRSRDEEKALLEPAHRLYGWLIAPIKRELDGAHATTIAWALDGVLRYMPINVLHDGERYMIERYTNVIFTPTDMVGLDVKPDVRVWRALGVGISKQYLSKLNPLPGVPGELRAIVHDPQDTGSHGPLPGKILLNDAFTEQEMEQQLQQGFPLVHIASHFVIGMSMDDSYLLLGGKKPGDTTGYQLRLSDVETTKGLTFEATALLSLSACETAISKNKSDGKEIDSLAEIGRQKGAQAVLASLWAVNDDSTAFLMADFYRRWTGNALVSKAEALRAAQLALLRPADSTSSERSQVEPYATGTLKTSSVQTIGASRYSHPYYWAAFILIGNWQ